jgi:hypothetical protein
METTHVSETSTLYNHTPGNYPKEDNIRFSQHGESLKTRTESKSSVFLPLIVRPCVFFVTHATELTAVSAVGCGLR